MCDDCFRADEVLSDIERRCRCTVCGCRRADLRPDHSKQQAAKRMMPSLHGLPIGGEYLSLAFSDDEISLVEIVEVDPDQGDRAIG
jgi:hypothetical protein